MKHILFFFSAILLCIASSCSENNYEPEPPTELESMPLATLTNDDGTYYTLHESFIRLRNADGSIIKSLDLVLPDPVTINTGYGNTKELVYKFFRLLRFDNSIIALALSRDDINKQHCAYAYAIDTQLSSYKRHEIAYVKHYEVCNDHLIAINGDGRYYVYSNQFLLELDGSFNTQVKQVLSCGFTSPSFYALVYSYSHDTHENRYFIINLSEKSMAKLNLPSISKLLTTYFPNETNEPRLDETNYAFVDDHIEISYSFTLYDGSKEDVILSYDFTGRSLEEKIANSPVHINLEYPSLWTVFGVHSAGDYRFFNSFKNIPSDFHFSSDTYTGYGGVILVNTFIGEVKAYDAACPVEADRDITLYIDSEKFRATCPKCGSEFNIFENNGVPLSGKAMELKYALKQYQAIKMGSGYVITN